MSETAALCEKCEIRPWEIICSCSGEFCEECFQNIHLVRKPTHRQGGNRRAEDAWNWISGKLANFTISTQFKNDEGTKWFGLSVNLTKKRDRLTSIVETRRLSDLMTSSIYHQKNGPRRQFPSITSFVGETGAGKSTLIRSMIYYSKEAKNFDPLEAPVPGAASGSSAILSTTGEVNLYLDPTTFGTEAPTFYADCEGMLGTEPVAAQHQSEWARYGKRYPVITKDGKHMDRRTAVQTLYPRFLYIFSDVICYVTRNHKAWADSALRLLEWSMVGAQSTINQHALPALIIILNGPTLENEEWISGDLEAATKDFFSAVEKEITENNTIRSLADKFGDQTMSELFQRSFSSVHVHYVPLQGYKSLGTTATVMERTTKLAHRIRSDSQRVQSMRATSWTRLDTRQLSQIVHYAFTHLASGIDEPFDFGQCRRQLSIPASTEEHFSEVLGHCLKGQLEEKFEATSLVMASSLLRHTIQEEKKDAVLIPSVVFNKDMQAICIRAISQFLHRHARCAFIDPESRERCINTYAGHAQGHQNERGRLLSGGFFVSDNFSSEMFLTAVETAVNAIMLDINAKSPSSRRQWRRHAAEIHRANIAELRSRGGFPSMVGSSILHDVGSTSVCYGCFFGRPEHRLPCSHVICESCVKDFDGTPEEERYPGCHIHHSCIVCEATGPDWPHIVRVKPDLVGVRVLSLDGGGVRGLVELITLQRLEKLIALGLPLGQLFDLIMGTSAGGIIALGLGVQDRTVEDCIDCFSVMINHGFKRKSLTKSRGIGWLARLFRGSIYHTEALERALHHVFHPGDYQQLYGLRRPCRVAVTTTVGTDLKFIANYNRGGTGSYLNSQLGIWHAARCTSAAPMFFEHTSHAAYDCWDGGLKANNPIQDAVNESKSIWGTNIDFDLLVSVGSGQGEKTPAHPSSWKLAPQFLRDLLKALLSSMDGQATWEMFSKSVDHRVLNRTVRLNVKFEGQPGPALDDTTGVWGMQQVATRHKFHNNSDSSHGLFSPILGEAPDDMLLCLALRLQASLFFFEMEDMEEKSNEVAIRGWICCRIAQGDVGFQALMDRTRGFHVSGQQLELSTLWAERIFKPSVLIHEPKGDLDKPIRIDVEFHSEYRVSISGFPMKLKDLLDYGNEHSDNLQEFRTEQGETSVEGPDMGSTEEFDF
ncbi:hypothetical protein FE257_009697 [Aspergillus nanangensis]|uniref:PNPLA domain-containing protein n=1 Tax=Aspergillus nanangensis TaxID=2582783 RepID=A0AAD4GRT7_ASPNN|nr:hypothetical protein FE257_009697 [Aspergillus nanangensis]